MPRIYEQTLCVSSMLLPLFDPLAAQLLALARQHHLMRDQDLTVEMQGAADFGPCECCGSPTRRVWGFVHHGEATQAAYFVEWTPGAVPLHGACFDLILGQWGGQTTAENRVATSLRLRHFPTGPQFMVVDAVGRHHAASSLVSTALTREQVIGSSLATKAFAVVDAIWLGDARIAEIIAPAG
jgi:hypothetical protein